MAPPGWALAHGQCISYGPAQVMARLRSLPGPQNPIFFSCKQIISEREGLSLPQSSTLSAQLSTEGVCDSSNTVRPEAVQHSKASLNLCTYVL